MGDPGRLHVRMSVSHRGNAVYIEVGGRPVIVVNSKQVYAWRR